jgi:hypothetical protein
MSKKAEKKNMAIAARARAMEAAETLSKAGYVVLDGKEIKSFKDLATFFGVGKSQISKLKNMTLAQKEDLRKAAKAFPAADTRTRVQV